MQTNRLGRTWLLEGRHADHSLRARAETHNRLVRRVLESKAGASIVDDTALRGKTTSKINAVVGELEHGQELLAELAALLKR